MVQNNSIIGVSRVRLREGSNTPSLCNRARVEGQGEWQEKRDNGDEDKGAVEEDRKVKKGQTKLFSNYLDVLTIIVFNFINVLVIYLYILTGCATRLQ